MSKKQTEMNNQRRAIKTRRLAGKSLLVFVMVVFGLIVIFFAQKAIFKTANGVNLADRTQKLYNQTSVMHARRGTIYDQKGQPLAENTNTYSLYAVLDHKQKSLTGKPEYVQDKAKTARVLADNLPISYEKASRVLTPKHKSFQVEFGSAGQNISLSTKKKIQAARLPGLNFVSQPARLYPNGMFASHLIGLASSTVDQKTKQPQLVGQMGIERTFEKDLKGQDGIKKSQHDNYGYQIPSEKATEKKPRNGKNVHTTIDPSLQLLLENQMSQVDSDVHPKVLNAMLMDAKTGKIVAAAQRPSFNPQTGQGLGKVWRDTLTQDLYEPGSTMKIFTMAAAIDSGHYRGSDTYQSGIYHIGNQIVPDWNRNGWGTITYDKGFALSSNVAMAHLEENMGPKTWKNYINRFQLLQNNTSDFDQQSHGVMQFERPIEQANTAFGQGIQVTALQMMQGFTAIANDGTMVRPRLVDQVTDAKNQKVLKRYPKKIVGHPISATTAQQMRKHMEDVVYKSYGIGHDFQIDGYRVAAKTGTAQVTDANGQYENGNDSYLYSVAGMAPAKHPRYIMYVTMKQPQLGSQSATKEIAKIFNVVMKKALDNERSKQKMTPLPDVTKQPVAAAQAELQKQKVNSVVIGTGATVQQQSPAPKAPADLSARVLLRTDGQLKMPDLTGWSKEEVEELARLVNLQVNYNGTGHVKDQSIKPNQDFAEHATLDVALN
ncbi:penicillin-binding protein [Fructilactobacillus myrtifloralis]|uniref:Penicillin-binding protein n=1 Tax=Fructilactobacillus myrtifloralis TaxID=2940301 RepID=A0ABY5BPD6_9LACO|nr:penicillin-binding transpeptidase domain-containing protein [Fructilactobacillus myrtifloralis]USS85527.1 penicillin-binding protein [Fructilactobacillus myrtifloralis]